MNVSLNDDFQDFVKCLNVNNVEYLIVGGYAVMHYGYNRSTGDIDIWVNRSKANYDRLKRAFVKFGMPVFDMNEENFLENQDMNVFTFGKPPVSIEILTAVKGLDFEDAITNSVSTTWNGIPVKVIDIKDLIRAKKASGRYKDLEDLENLE